MTYFPFFAVAMSDFKATSISSSDIVYVKNCLILLSKGTINNRDGTIFRLLIRKTASCHKR